MSETDTTIRISQETKNRLDKHGGKPDSYEDIVKRLLDEIEKKA